MCRIFYYIIYVEMAKRIAIVCDTPFAEVSDDSRVKVALITNLNKRN